MSLLFFRRKRINNKKKPKGLIELSEEQAQRMGWNTRPLSDRPLTGAWSKRVGRIK